MYVTLREPVQKHSDLHLPLERALAQGEQQREDASHKARKSWD